MRFGNPDNIAEAVLFLASPASAYMLGAEISVDGGMSQL
jgi:NAD(P)-dependent dehydrogenase (short-subunit alcohol dehydrogenase family)